MLSLLCVRRLLVQLYALQSHQLECRYDFVRFTVGTVSFCVSVGNGSLQEVVRDRGHEEMNTSGAGAVYVICTSKSVLLVDMSTRMSCRHQCVHQYVHCQSC